MAQPLPTQLPVPITNAPAPEGMQPYGTRGGANTYNGYGLVTAAYSVQPGEQIDCDPTAAGFTVTLPDATLCQGKACRVQDATGAAAAGKTIVIATVGGQTINSQAAATFNIHTANGGVSVRSNGANWTLTG